MVKVNIAFKHYDKRTGNESRECIIANIETNEKGQVERKNILNKIKSYGFTKNGVYDLEVSLYNRWLHCKVELV